MHARVRPGPQARPVCSAPPWSGLCVNIDHLPPFETNKHNNTPPQRTPHFALCQCRPLPPLLPPTRPPPPPRRHPRPAPTPGTAACARAAGWRPTRPAAACASRRRAGLGPCFLGEMMGGDEWWGAACVGGGGGWGDKPTTLDVFRRARRPPLPTLNPPHTRPLSPSINQSRAFDASPATSLACGLALFAGAFLYFPYVALGAWRRGEMRRRHGLPGSTLGDVALWAW